MKRKAPFIITFLALIILMIIAFQIAFFYDEGTLGSEILGRGANIVIYIFSFPTLIWKIYFVNLDIGSWMYLGFFINILFYSLIVQKILEYFRGNKKIEC